MTGICGIKTIKRRAKRGKPRAQYALGLEYELADKFKEESPYDGIGWQTPWVTLRQVLLLLLRSCMRATGVRRFRKQWILQREQWLLDLIL